MLRRTLPPGRRNGLDRHQTDDERLRVPLRQRHRHQRWSSWPSALPRSAGTPAGSCPCVAVARRSPPAPLPCRARHRRHRPRGRPARSQHRGTERRQSTRLCRRAELGDRRRRRSRIDFDLGRRERPAQTNEIGHLRDVDRNSLLHPWRERRGRPFRSRRSSVPLAATPNSLLSAASDGRCGRHRRAGRRTTAHSSSVVGVRSRNGFTVCASWFSGNAGSSLELTTVAGPTTAARTADVARPLARRRPVHRQFDGDVGLATPDLARRPRQRRTTPQDRGPWHRRTTRASGSAAMRRVDLRA